MKRLLITVPAALALFAVSTHARAESIDGREIFGVRVGGVFSAMELDEAFGKGSELEIHFVEGLGSWYGIGVALSGHDFGKSRDREADLDFTGTTRAVDLLIYSITGAFYAQTGLSERLSGQFEAGGGLYTTTASIPAGAFLEGRITKNQPGIYTGAGLSYRITDGGLSLGMICKFHYVFSGDHYKQAIYFYTGEERAHFFQIAVGVTFFTGN